MVARTEAKDNSQQAVEQTSQDAADFNQTMLQLMIKQAAHNAQVVIAVAMANDWSEAWRIQSDYVRASLERKMYLCWRGIELLQNALTSSIPSSAVQARKAA